MAKFTCEVGFATYDNSRRDDVYEETITPKNYTAEELRSTRRIYQDNQMNDNIKLSNRIFIYANPFALHNYQSIRYAKYLGTNWKVDSVEIQYPRLIMELGGVYNG